MAYSFDTTGYLFDGWAWDRSVFRNLVPDARIYAYAAGWLNCNDANASWLQLVYQLNDYSLQAIGSVIISPTGWTKVALGPYDVYGTSGVPPGEQIPMIRLYAKKMAGVAGSLDNWNIQLRFFTQRS